MKRIAIPILFSLFFLLAAERTLAQTIINGVTIYEPTIEKINEQVFVSFRAEIGAKAAGRNYSLVFAPMLTDDLYEWTLTPIVVQGRRARLAEQRHAMAAGEPIDLESALFSTNGSIVDYQAAVPYQLWMEGARLVIEGINVGCCSQSSLAIEIMAEELVLSPPMPVSPIYVVEIPPVPECEPARPLTTGEKLMESFTFIAPADRYVPLGPGELSDEDRDGAITIHFPQGGNRVMREFGGNRQSLVDLMSAIRVIEDSHDSRVKTVLVAGFASPEGNFPLNDRLAWTRAVAMKEYILENSVLTDDQIVIYNGSEDWRGLRNRVEASEMPWREAVLDIIDNVPILDSSGRTGRLGRLEQLQGGEPYRYMLQHYFPQLRNAAYIKLYFENK